MRRNPISKVVLKLLKEGEAGQAIELFNEQCDVRDICQYAHSFNNCKKLCLMPKMSFLALRELLTDFEKMVVHLK